MPSTPAGIVIDPNGRTVTAHITAENGAAVAVYTSRHGDMVRNMPSSHTGAPVEFWLVQPARYRVSLLVDGVENANGRGGTRLVDLTAGGVFGIQAGQGDGPAAPVDRSEFLTVTRATATFVASDGQGGFTVAGQPVEVGGGTAPVETVPASGAARTLTIPDGSSDGAFDVTLTANCTLSFAGATDDRVCTIVLALRQDSTGGRTVNFPASVQWATGAAPTLQTAAGRGDLLQFVSFDGGQSWIGSLIAAAIVAPGVPAPPVLAATGGNGAVELTWNTPAAVPAVTGYKIMRGTVQGGSKTLVATVGAVNAYTDTGRTNGTAYYYTIIATNSFGDSAESAEQTATPALSFLVDDPFTAADNTSLNGRTPPVTVAAAPWMGGSTNNATGVDPLRILSNELYLPSNVTQQAAWVNAADADVTVIGDYTAIGDGGLVWRATDNDNYFTFSFTGQVFRKQGGTFTQVATFTAAGAGEYRVTTSGSTHTVFINGAQVAQFTDAFNATATRHGARFNLSPNATRLTRFRVSAA